MPEGCRADFVDELAAFIYAYQGLIAGILAFITVLFILAQMRQIEQHRQDDILRKNRAARAGLPIALSSVIDYCEKCIVFIDSEYTAFKDDNFPYTNPAPTTRPVAPEYPFETFKHVQSVVEFASHDDAEILAEFIAFSQIQYSRLYDLIVASKSGTGTLHSAQNEISFRARLYDAIGLYKFAERIFDYARLRSSSIKDFCDASEAINSIFVKHSIQDEKLFAVIQENWPPKVVRADFN